MDEADVRRRILEGIAAADGDLDLAEDDFGNLVIQVSCSMFHLDADALNDRLQAWIAREVRRSVPGASAYVSFREASPAHGDDPELDFEEEWHGLRPSYRLELTQPPPAPEHVEAFVARIPDFLSLIGGKGRPSGWRDPHVGTME